MTKRELLWTMMYVFNFFAALLLVYVIASKPEFNPLMVRLCLLVNSVAVVCRIIICGVRGSYR